MAGQYRPVNDGTPESEWVPFLKQLHMSSAVWTLYFVHGLAIGAPTVFIPQMRRDWNSTVTVDDELASWFYSTTNIAALPWIFIMPILSHLIGRKIPYLACSTAMTIVFALMYFSSAPHHILTAQVIQGLVSASSTSIIIHIIPEYCTHKHRNVYLNIQCTTFYWGMWISNAIGTFFPWKYITILGLICSLYNFTVCFYPESPRWLASKGKLTQCKSSHRWIYGYSADEEKQLQDLIDSQANPGKEQKITWSWIRKTLSCKQFYLPLFLVLLIGAQYNFSGKFVCSIYAIDVLKKITKDEGTAYTGMLILDGVTVFGMYVGSVLPKFMKLRPLFLKLSILSIVVMFTFSLYLYLAKLNVIREDDIVTLGLLAVYSLAISSGPIILCVSICSEIVSIRYQAVTFLTSSFIFLVSSTGMLKFAPVIFNAFGIHGSFLFYGIASGVATVFIYVYLPETRDKTLVEIEKCFEDAEPVPESETLTNPIEGVIKH